MWAEFFAPVLYKIKIEESYEYGTYLRLILSLHVKFGAWKLQGNIDYIIKQVTFNTTGLIYFYLVKMGRRANY
jgi:hypothetical protein